MGRFLKYSIIIAVICIGLGVFATSAGASKGGFAKLKEEILAGEWSFGVDPFFDIEEQEFFDENENVSEQVDSLTEYYGTADFDTIHIKSAGMKVTFQVAEADETSIDVVKCGKYQSFLRDGTLYVIMIGESTEDVGDGGVTIVIPETVANEGMLAVEVEAGAGIIDLGTLSAFSVEIEVSAGVVEWQYLVADHLYLDVKAGAINGQDMDVTGNTQIEMSAGSVTLAGSLGTESEIELTAGKLELSLTEPFETYNYDLSCAGGRLSVGEIRLEGLADSEEIDNQATKNMDIECSAGTVNINLLEE